MLQLYAAQLLTTLRSAWTVVFDGSDSTCVSRALHFLLNNRELSTASEVIRCT